MRRKWEKEQKKKKKMEISARQEGRETAKLLVLTE
jgi:hypothetical protein